MCAGTKVIGPARIGDDVCVGAYSVVNKDLPSHCVCAGSPRRVLRRGEGLLPLVNSDYEC